MPKNFSNAACPPFRRTNAPSHIAEVVALARVELNDLGTKTGTGDERMGVQRPMEGHRAAGAPSAARGKNGGGSRPAPSYALLLLPRGEDAPPAPPRARCA